MAEILGAVASGITLAALFKTCIEAFDLIQTAHNQELDFRKLMLRLSIEKCRLFTWGESLGFTTAGDDSEPMVSASCQFHDVMMETMETLFQLFNDSKKLQERYGCKQYLESPFAHDEQTGQVRILAASFNNFEIKRSLRGKRTKILKSARWAIHDRKKFASFVSDIKELVDGLQDITKPLASVSGQENATKRRIESINDAETLNMVSEVCHEDHPALSQVASDRADTISSATTTRWKIERWHISPTAIEYGEIDSLEALDITELKHQMLRMMMERQELKNQINDLQGRFSDFSVVSASTAFIPNVPGRILSFELEEEHKNPPQGEPETLSSSSLAPNPSLEHTGEKSGTILEVFRHVSPQISTGMAQGKAGFSEFREGHGLLKYSTEILNPEIDRAIQSVSDMRINEEDIAPMINPLSVGTILLCEEPVLNDNCGDASALTLATKAINHAREEELSDIADLNDSIEIPQNPSKIISDAVLTSDELMVARLKEETAGFYRGPNDCWRDQMVSALLAEGKLITEVTKSLELLPDKGENADEQYGLTNSFLDFDSLTGGRHGTEIGREDYFVLSFAMPRPNTSKPLLESLGHQHYVNAMHVGRLTRSRDAPTVPSQWPRNLQIFNLVAGASTDEELTNALQQQQSHVYLFCVTSFSTVCSTKRGCLHNLFDALADGEEYAYCVPEMVDLSYPTPTVCILPFGPSNTVPRFLKLFQPGLVPQSKTLLILLVYNSNDFRRGH